MHSIEKFFLKKKSHFKKNITSERKLFVVAFFLLAVFGGLNFFFSRGDSSVTTFVPRSSELGIAAFSPLGENGGSVVPASCPSDLHDSPSYGQACGCGNGGTIQCGGGCSISDTCTPPPPPPPPPTPTPTPPPPACVDEGYGGTSEQGCPPGEVGSNTWFDHYDSCNNYLYSTPLSNTCAPLPPEETPTPTPTPTPPPTTCSDKGAGTWRDAGCPSGYTGRDVWFDSYDSCGNYLKSTHFGNTCTPPASTCSDQGAGIWTDIGCPSGFTGSDTWFDHYDSCGNYLYSTHGTNSCTPPPAVCGDWSCTSGETCSSCPSDCGSCYVPVPTVTLTADPPSIVSGYSSRLTYLSTHADSCFATGGWTGWRSTRNIEDGPGPDLSENVSPTVNTTYTIECWNSVGVSSGQKSVTVTVVPDSVPTLIFVANPTVVSWGGGAGGSSTLSWSTTNAVSCTASGLWWSGTKAVSGTETQTNIARDKTYTLECQNSIGTKVSRTATVTVVPGPACTPDCSTTRTDKVCSGQSLSDTCSGTCTGTRHCDYNWKEVAP